MSKQKAQEQAVSLGREFGCSSSEPAQLLTCLREQPAQSINAAQTKLLAVSGPLQAWSPVVDGVVVGEQPFTALNSGRFHQVPLLLGSSAEDGLISRAKNIKNFEQLQGRADSKTAFYEALSNSLGGEDANVFVKEAATWFYSLQHSPTPSGYNVFSRALENATRDFFITCPSVDMASFWASHTRSSVYMYHLPDYMAQSRTPNLPLSVSTMSLGEVLPPWPQFLPHPSGQNYKELSPSLSNRKSLRTAQCSFWSQYVPILSASTGKLLCENAVGDAGASQLPTSETKPVPLSDFSSSALSQNSTATPLMTTELDPYNRTQYCKWPCKCPKSPSVCPPGVSLLTDGCDCCKACAKQVGETCNEKDTCDYHKGLYCDYSADKPRYEKGVCAYMMGSGCEYDGVIYRNGQSFQPSCKYRCLCVNGAIGCVPLCTDSLPPRVWCQSPKLVKIPGRCCEQWICDEPRKPRKTSPRHAVEVSLSTNDIWHKNCITQTTPWSPCSKTCGRGVSLRISNENAQCEMEKETRLCNLRPCEVDITKHFRPGKKCLNIYREREFQNFTISGCISKKPYWPKYCGVCSDERCCIPYKSKTIEVEFECPNGSIFTWKYMWINACFCNLSCRNPNDIFSELQPFYEHGHLSGMDGCWQDWLNTAVGGTLHGDISMRPSTLTLAGVRAVACAEPAGIQRRNAVARGSARARQTSHACRRH
ncbi:hypothetical protein SRHO_G00052030 [Serrasalmus rhombeus]